MRCEIGRVGDLSERGGGKFYKNMENSSTDETSSEYSTTTAEEEVKAPAKRAPAGQRAAPSQLMAQDLSKLDIASLTPLTPEVISSQATINIGTIGHVAHGKTTVVQAISGKRVSYDPPPHSDYSIHYGEDQKHHDQAGLRECQDLQMQQPRLQAPLLLQER